MLAGEEYDELIMSLVEESLHTPPDDRERYLRNACSDPTIYAEVRKRIDWEERMAGFLLDPLVERPPLTDPISPGHVLDDRFRITRKVGYGGMGIVYEAVDEKLDRRVALKCAKLGHGHRLPPEARAAREVSHFNVCKVHDLHSTSTEFGELDYLSMEFIEGQTLSERISREGPLTEPEAREIARQICAGLAQAHRQGVIHGDLKCSNIILTRSERAVRAVITDFGLARLNLPGTDRLASAALVGTFDYMAPELLKGNPAGVASDIYALGILFHNMLTGRTPERLDPGAEKTASAEQSNGRSAAATVGAPPSLADWERRIEPLPPLWKKVVRHCLESSPLDRFSTADEIATALEPRPLLTRRRVAAAVAAIILAAATGVVAWQRATGPKESVKLAILPFQSGPQSIATARELVSDTAAQLGTVQSSRQTRFRFMPTRDGAGSATHVLQGTVSATDGGIEIHAVLTDTRRRVNVRDWTGVYSQNEMKYAPLALAGLVTWGLHLPSTAPPIREQATRYYLEGLAHLRNPDTEIESARNSTEKSVAADPDSALTYAGLAEAQWYIYFQTRQQDWLDRATESARRATLRHPDLAPVHRIAGWLKYNAGRYEQAEAELRRAVELDSANDAGHRRLAQVLESSSQFDEAMAEYKRALDADGTNYANYQDLGALYATRGALSDALPYYLKAVALAPRAPGTHYVLASDYRRLTRFQEAEQELRLAISLKETAPSVHMLGEVLMFQGRDREAVPYFQRALELAPNQYISWMFASIAWRRLGNAREAVRATRRGLELTQVVVTQDARGGYARSLLAYLCSELGLRQRARFEIEQALQLSPGEADVKNMAVWTYEALGLRAETLKLAASFSEEQLARLNKWPDLAALHQDYRFTRLLNDHSTR